MRKFFYGILILASVTFAFVFTLLLQRTHAPIEMVSAAATYYISPTGSDTSGNGTNASPWNTAAKAFSVMVGGDTLIYKNGTYTYSGACMNISDNTFPAHTNNWITIKGETLGSVILDAPCTSPISVYHNNYLVFSDFYLKNTDTAIYWTDSDHLKALRVGIKNGARWTNNYGTAITLASQANGGANNRGVTDSLLEDIWITGVVKYGIIFGGTVSYTERNICRRCVIRWDGAAPPTNPTAGIVNYGATSGIQGARNNVIQNSIAIDFNPCSSPYFKGGDSCYGGFYMPHSATNIQIYNSISLHLGSGWRGMMFGEDSASGNGAQNSVVWDVGSSSLFSANNASGINLQNMTAFSTSGTYFNNGATITNSIVSSTPPNQPYILQAPGTSGATIINQRGVSGTLYGETGWNDVTTVPLWPYPYENFIHDLFAEPDTGPAATDNPSNVEARGFAAPGKTLTRYIWEYLGNPCPANICTSGGGDTTAPSTPTGLSATAISSSQVNLSWTASTDNIGVTGYRVYRNGTQVGTPSGTSYSDTGLNPSTSYSYTVAAVDAATNLSSQSSAVNATTQAGAPDTTPPSTPTGLSATAISSSQINLSWTASTDNVGVTGYRIFRGGTQIATGVSGTTYSDTGLATATTYSYTIAALDGAGNISGQSTAASATTQQPSANATLIAPGDAWKYFKGTTFPGATWNAISFNDTSWLSGPTGIGYGDTDDVTVLSDMVSSYATVYTRKTFSIANAANVTGMTLTIDYDDGYVAYVNGQEVSRQAMPTGAVTNTTLANLSHEAGIPEVFDISAFKNALVTGTNVLAIEVHNQDLASSDLSFIPTLAITQNVGSADTQAPTTPTGLSTTVISSSQINLSWTASTDNVAVIGYRVYRNGTQVGTPATNSYSDTGLTPSTAYTYTVAAVDGAGNLSTQSASANGTTQAGNDTIAPSTPTGLSATAISSSQINLSWTASTDNVGVTGYKVLRGGVQVATSTSNSYSDTNLTPSTAYSYTVRAFDLANNVSAASSAASATTQSPPVCTPSAPQFSHVFIIVEENHNYSSIIGNTTEMPYLNGLLSQYGLATNYYGNTHPSIGNYFMMTTGQIVTNNDSFTGTVSVDNIVRQMVGAGKTWKSYSESLPFTGYVGGDSGSYAQRHNPFSYFTDVVGSVSQVNNLVPFTQFATDLANNALPQYAYIVPNLLNDGHDGTLTMADNWLKNNIDPVIKNTVFQNSLILILFDESESDNTNGGGKIPALVISPKSKVGYQSNILYQHQNALRLSAEAIGLCSYPGAANTATAMTDFFTTATADTIAPSTPTGLSATAISSSQINLSWTASTDNVAVTGYRVYRNGTQVGTPSGTSYSDTGLTAATTYSYRVAAVDAAANISAQSSAVNGTTQASAPADITTGLIGYWAMNDGSGTVIADSSGSSNPGTLTGGTTWVAGKVSGALSLNGTNAYAVVPGTVENNLTNFTVAGWIWWNGSTSWQHVFDFNNGTIANTSGTYMFLTTQNDSNVPQFSISSLGYNNSQDIVGTGAFPLNQWVHVTVTHQGNVGTLYINGVAVGTNNVMTLTPSALATTNNWFGRSPDTTDPYFSGRMDEMRLYNRALTSTDIQQLMAVTATDVTPPSTPTALVASVISSSQINLSWAASTDNVAVTGYRVYRNGTQVGTPTANSYSDTGLTPSTAYTYTIAAIDAAGNLSTQSTAANATTQAAADTTVPSTPTNLSASAISSSQINLTWTASTDNVGVTGYKVLRGGVQVATSTSNSFSDTGLSPSTSYTYTVRAFDAANNVSALSTSASATTQAPPPVPDTTPPSTPTNLSASAISSSQINLSWITSTDNIGVVGYKVFRGGVQVATSTTNSYSDTNVSPSTTYSYTVRAYDAANNISPLSTSASATTQAPPDSTPPSTPTNLAATAISYNTVNLTWTASTDNTAVAGYKVLRGGVQVATSTSNSFSDTNLAPTTSYTYTVRAFDVANNVSALSTSASATTQAPPTLSVSLTATPGSGAAPLTGVSLTANVGGTATGNINYTFYCNRPDQGTNVTTPNDLKADNQPLPSYTATNLCNYTNPGSYTTKVIVERGPLVAQTIVDVVVVAGDTTAPTIATIVAVPTTNSVTITWVTSEPATTQVDYGFSSTYGQSTTLDTTLSLNHSVTIPNLSQNTLYNYRVRSKDGSNNEALSVNRTFTTLGTIIDVTPPAPITNIQVSNITDTSAVITWSAPGDDNNTGTAAIYDIRYADFTLNENSFSLGPQATGAPTPLVAGTQQVYTLIGLTASTTYNIAIRTKDEVLNTSLISNVIAFNTAKQTTNTDPGNNGNGNGGGSSNSGGNSGGGGGGGGGGGYYDPDTTAPNPVTKLAAQGAENQIQITWKNPNDYDWVRTVIVRKTDAFPKNSLDGLKVYEGSGEEYSDIKLQTNQTYYYAVFTLDRVPNYSVPVTISAKPVVGQSFVSTISNGGSGFNLPSVATSTSGLVTFGSGNTISTTGVRLPILTGPYIIGTRSNQVKYLQQVLKDPRVGGPTIFNDTPTGLYGPLTVKAVQAFQTKYKIVSSGTPQTTGYGFVGKKTLTKLNELITLANQNVTTTTTISTSTQEAQKQVLQTQINFIRDMIQKLLEQIGKK